MKDCYKKENLEKVVAESFSISEVLRKLGKKELGSNFATINKYIKLYDLNISHFTGQKWNKGLSLCEKTARIKIDEILKENTNFACSTLKKRLFALGLKEEKCEKCGVGNKWLDEDLKLELHHINGNHFDNRLENLQILCPNCHSQTNSYKRRHSIREENKREKPSKFSNTHLKKCDFCGKEFNAQRGRNRFCSLECYKSYRSKDNKNILLTKENLENMLHQCSTMTDLAKKLNTSRTTIRKYLEEYNLLNDFKSIHCNEILHTKSILQFDLNWNFIKEWDCIADAERTLGIKKSISKCLKHQRNSAGGFKWRYKEN